MLLRTTTVVLSAFLLLTSTTPSVGADKEPRVTNAEARLRADLVAAEARAKKRKEAYLALKESQLQDALKAAGITDLGGKKPSEFVTAFLETQEKTEIPKLEADVATKFAAWSKENEADPDSQATKDALKAYNTARGLVAAAKAKVATLKTAVDKAVADGIETEGKEEEAAKAEQGEGKVEKSVSDMIEKVDKLKADDDFKALSDKAHDLDVGLQLLEARYDNKVLGVYVRQKLDRLLTSIEFCDAAASCATRKPPAGGDPSKANTDKLYQHRDGKAEGLKRGLSH